MTTTQSARTDRGFWHRWTRTQAQVEAEELQEQLRGSDDAALTAIDCCTPGQTVTVRGMVRSVTLRPKSHAPALEIDLYDGSGSISVVWLGRRRIPGVKAGLELRLEGMVTVRDGLPTMFNPRYEILSRQEEQ